MVDIILYAIKLVQEVRSGSAAEAELRREETPYGVSSKSLSDLRSRFARQSHQSKQNKCFFNSCINII